MPPLQARLRAAATTQARPLVAPRRRTRVFMGFVRKRASGLEPATCAEWLILSLGRLGLVTV